ncbi:MAG: hypothetical protein K0R63_136 [Rickettsiales bacterium]|jgi:hypothetical protein|nr:hypothetical protein [Rickettsiales bacterium]
MAVLRILYNHTTTQGEFKDLLGKISYPKGLIEQL